MNRDKFVVANWKMNLSHKEAVRLAIEIKNSLLSLSLVKIILAPPYLFIPEVKDILEKTAISMGAQNVYWEEKGTFTGEISSSMLEDFCDFVIVGHSERRANFNETNEEVNKKVTAVLKNGMKVIICVGESPEAWKKGDISSVIDEVEKAIEGVDRDMIEKVIVAYEPIWAIGSGKPAASTYANKICLQIRQVFSSKYGRDIASKIPILYGGSVDSFNATGYVDMSEIDGLLIGSASLNGQEFINIVKKVSKIK